MTVEDMARGRRIAATALGPAGCHARAKAGAEARWGRKPQHRCPRPANGLVFLWAEAIVSDLQGTPGWAKQTDRLSELIEWVKQARRE